MQAEQTTAIWEKRIEAEVRSYYFAALAESYTKRKQWLTGSSFFLSSGAAATIVAKSPDYIPIIMALVSALCNAYSIATALDRRISTLAKLKNEWSSLAAEYENLYYHWFDDDSEQVFNELVKRGRDASQLGSTDAAPYNPELMKKWEEWVFARYKVAA